MLEKFLNIFRIEDLRKRIFFTLGLLAVYGALTWVAVRILERTKVASTAVEAG